MRVGVGLPSTVPGVDGRELLDWARRADAGPFGSVGVLDRIAYQSIDPFAALAGAAAVTGRLSLVTMVVIGPLRPAALLAKQAASIDEISGGRLVLGLAVGARTEDYRALGVDPRSRGDRLTHQILEVRDRWEDQAHVPRQVAGRAGGPPILVGGLSGVSFARMARCADGYVHGGGPPRAFASAASRATAAWIDAGRPGRPELWGQGYFALGEEAVEAGERYLRDYYAFTGPFAARIAAGNLTSPRAIVDYVRGYEDAGCDGLVLLPTAGGLDQVDRLAEAVG